jgi:CHAD domain-containing protein
VAYQLDPDERVREGITRCAREQLDQAVAQLSEGINENPVSAIHAARKAIKKERSLLRLARDAMPAKQRRRENAALGDAARGLSGARDGDVMIETLQKLSERFAGQVPAKTFSELRKRLESERESERRELVGSALEAHAVQELGAVRLRVDDWQLRQGGWKSIEGGLDRSYRRGRKGLARARGNRALETWHEWRKRVKDLWYQERLLSATCGPTVQGHAEDAHRLAELLGDDHDLGILHQRLTSGKTNAPVDLDAVLSLIDHRRGELQTEAIHIGGRLYAESPKSYRRRMKRSWKAGRAQAGSATRQDPTELAEATRTPQHG